METQTETIKAIYYRSHQGMLRGKLDECTMFYNLFEREFNRCDNKEIFQEFLTPERMDGLMKIKKQVKSQILMEEFVPFQPIEHPIKMTETEIEEERLVVHQVAKDMSVLEPFLSSNLKLRDLEHPCGPDRQDRCDMVAMDSDSILYAIEFKLKKANHSVVGQINKYCLHFDLRLSHNLYRKVHGVIIANSYSQFAINELKKRGYTCLAYSGKLDNLKFTKI